MDIGDKKAIEKTSQALREGMDVRHKKAIVVAAQEGADTGKTTMQQPCAAGLQHHQQQQQFAIQDDHSDAVNTFMPSSTTAQHMIVPKAQNLVATTTLDAQQQQNLIHPSALPSMQTNVSQSSQLNTVVTDSAVANIVPPGLSTQAAVNPSSDPTTQGMAVGPPNPQNTPHELTASAVITASSSQTNPYFTSQQQTANAPPQLPPPPHFCIICGYPENATRPLCFFPPNLLIHAFCGTLAASPSYNKPQYELLHLKGIKHKFRHDETLLKLLPAALSRTRSAMNTSNNTRLYMVRDLEMNMKELRELQINNGGDVSHVVHSHITVAGTGKRGRGRPRKGEIVLPKVKRPRGRPPKDPEKLISTTS